MSRWCLETSPLLTTSLGWRDLRPVRATAVGRGGGSAPAGLFVGVDPEREFSDELVGEQRVGGVDQAEAGVAEELLHPVALEDPAAAGELERGVDDAPGAGDRDVLGGDD